MTTIFWKVGRCHGGREKRRIKARDVGKKPAPKRQRPPSATMAPNSHPQPRPGRVPPVVKRSPAEAHRSYFSTPHPPTSASATPGHGLASPPSPTSNRSALVLVSSQMGFVSSCFWGQPPRLHPLPPPSTGRRPPLQHAPSSSHPPSPSDPPLAHRINTGGGKRGAWTQTSRPHRARASRPTQG